MVNLTLVLLCVNYSFCLETFRIFSQTLLFLNYTLPFCLPYLFSAVSFNRKPFFSSAFSFSSSPLPLPLSLPPSYPPLFPLDNSGNFIIIISSVFLSIFFSLWHLCYLDVSTSTLFSICLGFSFHIFYFFVFSLFLKMISVQSSTSLMHPLHTDPGCYLSELFYCLF